MLEYVLLYNNQIVNYKKYYNMLSRALVTSLACTVRVADLRFSDDNDGEKCVHARRFFPFSIYRPHYPQSAYDNNTTLFVVEDT